MDDYKIHVELAVDIPRDSKLGERIIAFSKASGKSPEQVAKDLAIYGLMDHMRKTIPVAQSEGWFEPRPSRLLDVTEGE